MPPRLRPQTRLFSLPASGRPPASCAGDQVRAGASPVRTYANISREPPHLLRLLAHKHLASPGRGSFVSYDTAHAAQESLRSVLLAWKNLPDDQRPDPPRPHLLSFEPTPTITLGRRQTSLTPAQSSRLQAPLRVVLPNRPEPVPDTSFTPDVRQTARGGLTTYHGPGQLVFWPVIDMHSPQYDHFSVLSYAAHLEATTRRLLAELFSLESYTTRDEPGVWVPAPQGQPERKIAAMGVHHRRHVTSLGIALNIDVPVAGPEGDNPWVRFVPCGLEGKVVTSVAAELQQRDGNVGKMAEWDMPALAARWARLFDEGLLDATKRGVDGEDASLRKKKEHAS
ncbi:hypothetical protein B0T10DRAFT_66722 [Thelonectria olida]|uniref:BPL/LPL catalytic domain-containing protein n=1 Tax=Thelonectria olida TaxID=1576542 RepID=A0A9P9ARR0_9HYPO|nr:hypothetical protein B0T10DRAFT_66722 [Thelonectria olida]